MQAMQRYRMRTNGRRIDSGSKMLDGYEKRTFEVQEDSVRRRQHDVEVQAERQSGKQSKVQYEGLRTTGWGQKYCWTKLVLCGTVPHNTYLVPPGQLSVMRRMGGKLSLANKWGGRVVGQEGIIQRYRWMV